MFVFAVPGILPVPPGVSTILGTPLIFLSAQLMLGMRPWLPAVVTRRSFTRDDFDRIARLIHQHAGISLSPIKFDMVYSRLARVDAGGSRRRLGASTPALSRMG